MCSGLAASVGGGRSPQSATGPRSGVRREDAVVDSAVFAASTGALGRECLSERVWESETLAGGGLRWQSAAARYSVQWEDRALG